MKLLLGAILLLAMLVILVCLFKTRGEEHKLLRTVRAILLIGAAIMFFNIVTLFTESKAVCIFAYTVYFAASDWLLYYLFRFSLEFIGRRFENHVNRPLMLLLLMADTVSVFLNNIFLHLFDLNPVYLYGGELYFEVLTKPAFYIHYALILMLVVFCLISLYYQAVKAPSFYRTKYLVIAILVSTIIVANLVMLQSAIDISVIGYAATAVSIYYSVFVFTPQRLLQKTLFLVAQDISVGLFVMDIEGKVLYSNKYADKFLQAEKPVRDRERKTIEEWCRERYMEHEDEFTEERTFYGEEQDVVLKIQLQRMIDSKKQLQGGYFVIQDRTEEINNLKKERWLATHDSLTGLYNKERFCEKAERHIRQYPEQELLLICTDIKEFKMINDLFGTKVGDKVLANCARLLQERVSGPVLYGRIGNDIFGLLMPKESYKEQEFAKDVQEAFSSSIDEDVTFPLINYIGVYEITERDLPVSVMCDRARMAIATIKGSYHKRIAYYDNALRKNIRYEQELISELDEAIAQKQLKMYLQPQMSANGKLLGAEALVRWIHPRKGFISPGEFVPVFEKNGLISDVDKYIWETACQQLKKWKQEGREDLYISVNISPRDFYFLNIYQVFVDLVQSYDINPKNLKLEITETAVVMDFERQMELISRLRKNGFTVEMDDFGSGYSSLNMLKDIHVDVLKIDMAFLKKAEDEERSKKILEMIIGLSKQLEMPVITEGVETEKQVRFLSEMGCDMFQGYYFAKPMSVEQFEETYCK